MYKLGFSVVLAVMITNSAMASDQNNDGVIDSTDIDYWNGGFDYLEYYYGNNIPAAAAPWMDLNGNGQIEWGDRDKIVFNGCRTNYGDPNCDGCVDEDDLAILMANWQGTNKSWRHGDVNGDRVVNAADLNIIGLNWGLKYPTIGVVPCYACQ